MKKFFALLIGIGIALGLLNRRLKTEFDNCQEISLKELDDQLAKGQRMLVLFTWRERCPDSVAFQKNYLEDRLKLNEPWRDYFYVVNLDKEMPSALKDHKKRQPLMEKYGINTSPALVDFNKKVRIIAWDRKNSNSETAIDRTLLDEFFDGIE